jgi:hypothetical protein
MVDRVFLVLVLVFTTALVITSNRASNDCISIFSKRSKILDMILIPTFVTQITEYNIICL